MDLAGKEQGSHRGSGGLPPSAPTAQSTSQASSAKRVPRPGRARAAPMFSFLRHFLTAQSMIWRRRHLDP